MADVRPVLPPTTQLWRCRIEVVFEATDAEEAAEMAAEISGGMLDHEAVWNIDVEQDLQPQETVDAA